MDHNESDSPTPPASVEHRDYSAPGPSSATKKRRLGGIAGAAAVAIGIFALKAGAIFGGSEVVGAVADHVNDAKRDASGAVVKTGRVDATALQPGDCWQDETTASTSTVNEVRVVPCTTAHNAQVAVIGQHTGAFPGGSGMADWCTDDLKSWAVDHDDVQKLVDADPDAGVVAFSADESKWKTDGANDVVCSFESGDDALDVVLAVN